MDYSARKIVAKAIEVGEEGYEVNATATRPLYTSLMIRIIEQMEWVRKHYSKLSVMVFTLHCCNYSASNQIWSKTIKRLDKELEQNYGDNILPTYFCVREQGKASAQHYHLALVFNGQLVQRHHKVLSVLQAIWKSYGGSKVSHSKTHTVARADQLAFANVIYHLSYLAKVRSKIDLPTQRNFFTRRLETS